jgi:hypothetical protein
VPNMLNIFIAGAALLKIRAGFVSQILSNVKGKSTSNKNAVPENFSPPEKHIKSTALFHTAFFEQNMSMFEMHLLFRS